MINKIWIKPGFVDKILIGEKETNESSDVSHQTS